MTNTNQSAIFVWEITAKYGKGGNKAIPQLGEEAVLTKKNFPS